MSDSLDSCSPDRPAARRLRVAALCLGIAAVAGVGGATIAAASIPGADGTIAACRSKVTGGLRVLDRDAGQKCNSVFETPLQWNQQGVSGPIGPQGPQGEQGPKGPQGEPGEDVADTDSHSRSGTVPAGSLATFEAPCPVGSVVTGGGYNVFALDVVARNVAVIHSFPVKAFDPAESSDRWWMRALNNNPFDVEVNVFALCAG